MKATLLITSGTGSEEVRRFVELLARKMTSRCEALGLEVRPGETRTGGTAPRSITLTVVGESLDALAREEGTHALIARSPKRSRHARKRWFASVKLQLEPLAPLRFRPDKLVVTACRAGGPGGQNVNKRSTAIRAMDPDSGVAVRVQEQRRQGSNRRLARERIRAMVEARREQEAVRHEQGLRALHYRVIRGNPVRTWRLDALGLLQEVV